MRDCPLFSIDKKEDIKISWKGSEECFTKNQKNLDIAFSGGSLSWKREGQRTNYPLQVRYKPKLVAFNEALIQKESTSSDFAFLHLFFLYPISFEDYRYNFRPSVSEWFAKLNEFGNLNWIIVFDSSRSKEKKVRVSILDKIRSDFSKHLSRLVEITDSSNGSDKSTLFSMIQSSLIASFNSYSNLLANSIRRLKESTETEDFSPVQVVNLQYKLCRFYWNLGLLENALHELSDMDFFLSNLIANFSDNLGQLQQSSQNNWLKRFKVAPFGTSCSYISVLMRQNILESDCSLTKLRCFILAHQILLTFHMFLQRYTVLVGSELPQQNDEVNCSDGGIRDEVGKEADEADELSPHDEPKNEVALQLRHNFVSFVLRSAYESLMHLIDELIALKANYSSALLNTLVVVWYAEVFYWCEKVADILQVETAAYFICQLTYIQCDSLLNLYLVLKSPSIDFTIARRWFEESAIEPDIEPSSSIFSEFFGIFFAKGNTSGAKTLSLFDTFLTEKLRRAEGIFDTFFWKHQARFCRQKMAELLTLRSNRSGVYECFASNVKGLFEERSTSRAVLVDCAKRMVEDFGDFLERDRQLSFDCYFILSLSDSAFIPYFMSSISSLPTREKRSNLSWNRSFPIPLRVSSVASEELLICEKNSEISLTLILECDFMLARSTNDDVHINAILKTLSPALLDPRLPTFTCSTVLTSDEEICRFICLSVGSRFTRGGSTPGADVYVVENNDDNRGDRIVLKAVSKRFTNGQNRVEFIGQASMAGCFALDSVCVTFAQKLCYELNCQVEIAQSKSLFHNIMCFVNIKKPVITLADRKVPPTFLAGIVQRICFDLSIGTIASDNMTDVKVSFVATKPLMKFLLPSTNEWVKEAKFVIPTLASESTFKLEVFFCLEIDRMNFSVDQSSLLHYDISVDWLDTTWFFPLTFMPIMNIKSSTSLLGDRVLFEVDVQRCDQIDGLRICPAQATLLQDQSVAKEPIEALLLNPLPLQPILANSSYRFVWQLPTSKIGKSIPITHYIKIRYAIESSSSSKSFEYSMPLERIVERKYSFENKLTFAVQRVEYEVCAHVLSERPQSVLCRIDLQCDLIVSLRSLTNKAESIVVVVEVDPQFWTAVDHFKVVHMKGSGVGQTSFSIIPKKVGFLPYPTLFVHRYLNAEQIDRHSFSETTFIGERLTSFHRNQGKQIHVLGHLHNGADDTSSVGSAATSNSASTTTMKRSLKSQAKDKFQKLFELKD